MKMQSKLIKMTPVLVAEIARAARRRAKKNKEPVNFSGTVRALLHKALELERAQRNEAAPAPKNNS